MRLELTTHVVALHLLPSAAVWAYNAPLSNDRCDVGEGDVVICIGCCNVAVGVVWLK